MKMCKVMVLAVIAFLCGKATGASRQCFKCRSRGELGNCRDPFPFNGTTGYAQAGIHLVSCPSGWCTKKIEGVGGPPDDFGTATERACLIQAPSDKEERCIEIKENFKTVLRCFCRGDVCNSSDRTIRNWLAILLCALFLRIT